MQMISCPVLKVAMAESASARMAVEKGEKRTYHKRHCGIHFLPDGQIVNNTHNMKSDPSLGGVNSESTDTGILYLNPQTPNWSLAEKFAELSPGDRTEICDDQGHGTEALCRSALNISTTIK